MPRSGQPNLITKIILKRSKAGTLLEKASNNLKENYVCIYIYICCNTVPMFILDEVRISKTI